ncbi:MAG: hypothetical protein ABIK28_15450, partial [Planctomycetota bacterium]
MVSEAETNPLVMEQVMQIEVVSRLVAEIEADTLIIPVFEGAIETGGDADEADRAMNGLIRFLA